MREPRNHDSGPARFGAQKEVRPSQLATFEHQLAPVEIVSRRQRAAQRSARGKRRDHFERVDAELLHGGRGRVAARHDEAVEPNPLQHALEQTTRRRRERTTALDASRLR